MGDTQDDSSSGGVASQLFGSPLIGAHSGAGLLGTETTARERALVRPITQPSRSLDISIPDSSRLDGPKNYRVWSLRMRHILERNRIWVYCLNPMSRSASESEMDGRELALSAIEDSVKDSLVTIVSRFTDPYDCWRHLQERYEPKSVSRRLMLLSKLISSKKEESQTMEQYLKEAKDIIDQLHDNAGAVPMDMIILLLLQSLPKEYDLFKKSFQQAHHDSLPNFNELETRLLDEELQVKMQAEKE